MKFLKILSVKILFLFVFLLICENVFAGVTGKIQGKIADKKTGELLPGVNVLIEGTSRGAATDINGEYVILQVPPGTYSLRVSFIGYQTQIIKNVKVSVDLTTTVNASLEEQSVQLKKEVVITAKRPVIQKDVTSSTQFIGIEELQQLPVTNTKEGLFVQAGVYQDPIPVAGGLGSAGRGEVRYSIRGSSQLQIKWYIDGVRTASLVNGRADWGGSFTNVNLNAIKEIQVMTGGFNAEYGEAEAGIVNVVTKTGSDKYHGSIEYIYGVPGQHHFGNYLYNRNTEKELIDHTLPNGSLDPNWWTPRRQRQVYDYTKIPDNTVYLSLSGPLLKINENKIKFFLSSEFKRQAYTFPHPRNSRADENGLLNISYQNGNSVFRLSGIYSHDGHSTLQENGDFTNQAKYYRGWGSLLDTYTYDGSFSWTNILSQKLFFDLKLSSYIVNHKEKPSKYTVIGKSNKPTLFGFQRYNGYEDEPFDAYAPLLLNHIVTGDLSLVGNLSWQFDKNNLLKTGFEFRDNIFSQKESYRLPSFTTNTNYWLNRGLNETYYPIQLSAYIQDKMEFESMILNLGVRIDYFNPNYNWFDPTDLFNLSVDPLYDASLDPDQDQVDENGHVKYSFQNVLDKPRSPAESFTVVSPRFGVSFPITENSLLHFNYGHFSQMPPLDEMFEFLYFRPENLVEKIMAEDKLAAEEGRKPRHIPSNDGDPERVVAYTFEPLKPERTIMFEVGIKHNFENFGVLDITAFYKDVFDQTEERVGLFDRSVRGYDPFRNQVSPNQSYASYFTGDYGDARGFEVSFRTLFSKTFALDLNYSFSRATQGRASPRQIVVDGSGKQTYIWDTEVNKRIPTEKSFSRPHILRANFYFNYPKGLGGDLLNSIFEGTSVSILYRFVSGQAFTYLKPNDPPDTYNNYRYPASNTVDLKLDKSFTISDVHNFDVYIRITNLLNTKNLRSFGDVVFDANAAKDFVEEGKITRVDAAGYDISWQTYFDKRRVYLGVKYSF